MAVTGSRLKIFSSKTEAQILALGSSVAGAIYFPSDSTEAVPKPIYIGTGGSVRPYGGGSGGIYTDEFVKVGSGGNADYLNNGHFVQSSGGHIQLKLADGKIFKGGSGGVAEEADEQDISGLALKSNVLELDNTDAFTPAEDYEPATKKYVDDLDVYLFIDGGRADEVYQTNDLIDGGGA